MNKRYHLDVILRFFLEEDNLITKKIKHKGSKSLKGKGPK